MRRRPGKRARVEIGTSYTLARWDEQSRRQVGPTILVDRPGPHPPLPLHQISPWAGQGLRLTRTTPMLKSNIVLAQPV